MSIAQWYKREYGKSPVFVLFCTILACSFALMVLLSVATRDWFFRWAMDIDFDSMMFGDHFESMMTSMDHPYTGYRIIYPPIITGVYAIMGWASYPYRSDIGGNLMEQFANSHVGMMGFILFMLVALILVSLLTHRMLDREFGGTRVSVLFCCFLLTIPFIYALERGNCILYSVVFMLIFLIGFRSENKKIRYVAYVALALAASIKLFPFVLAVLILKERRYSEFVWCSVITAALLVVPFVFFDGSIVDLFNNIFDYSSATARIENDLNIRGWVTILNRVLFNSDLPSLGFIVISFVLGISVLSVLLDREMPLWQAVAILGCNITIGFANSTGYIYLNMLPALLLFLLSEKVLTCRTLVYLILFAGIFSAAVAIVQIRSDLVAVLLVLLIAESVQRIRAYRRARGTDDCESQSSISESNS